jgi:CHAT domain-containing protein
MFQKPGLKKNWASAALVLLGILIVLACAGVLARSGRWRNPKPAVPQSRASNPRVLLFELHKQADQMFQARLFSAAAARWEAGLEEARRQGDQVYAISSLANLGACRVATFRYREGMAAYLAARDLARKRGDWETAAALASNISALYIEMGEIGSAVEAAETGLTWLGDRPAPYYRAKLLTNLARLRARTGDADAAVRLFGEAIDEADRLGDDATRALAWNQLGYELLRAGSLEAAEQALLESYRLRRFTRDKALLLSYRVLGMLRMAQGDLKSAAALLDQAVALAGSSPRLVPAWQLYHERGRVRLAQGRLPEALADFRVSVASARHWRPEVLPADPVRVSLEAGLQEIYSSFIEAGNRLYFSGGDRGLVRETFEVAEENRAYSLRALMAAPEEWRQELPPDYGETLARLRAAELEAVAGDSPPARERLRQLHYRLTEMEARAGLDFCRLDESARRGSDLLARTQRVLGADEALLSFHLAEPQSYVWGVTRAGLELHRLPSRSRFRDYVKRFGEALQRGSAEALTLGERLYGELCGGLKETTRSKAHWLLALDDVLFELPFAALPEVSRSGRPTFLIERHSLQVVPGAHLLVASREQPAPDRRAEGAFVGVGDPVYNTADPRWGGPPAASRGGRRPVELPRLAGSGREIRACAQLWAMSSSRPSLLEGAEASRERVLRSLDQRPAVVHFATHVVSSERQRGLIALSLLPSGDVELFSPLEIAHQRLAPRLVVLSGCGSAQGEILPGVGLMGLTRAWLAAGASTVVATRWPTPDDSGELLLRFYGQLQPWTGDRPGSRPAVALQRAQVEVLESASWRSSPHYWAAYFAVGRE